MVVHDLDDLGVSRFEEILGNLQIYMMFPQYAALKVSNGFRSLAFCSSAHASIFVQQFTHVQPIGRSSTVEEVVEEFLLDFQAAFSDVAS